MKPEQAIELITVASDEGGYNHVRDRRKNMKSEKPKTLDEMTDEELDYLGLYRTENNEYESRYCPFPDTTSAVSPDVRSEDFFNSTTKPVVLNKNLTEIVGEISVHPGLGPMVHVISVNGIKTEEFSLGSSSFSLFLVDMDLPIDTFGMVSLYSMIQFSHFMGYVKQMDYGSKMYMSGALRMRDIFLTVFHDNTITEEERKEEVRKVFANLANQFTDFTDKRSEKLASLEDYRRIVYCRQFECIWARHKGTASEKLFQTPFKDGCIPIFVYARYANGQLLEMKMYIADRTDYVIKCVETTPPRSSFIESDSGEGCISYTEETAVVPSRVKAIHAHAAAFLTS